MKLSELTIDLVKAHARVDEDIEDQLIENVYMPAALQHLCGVTGLTKAQLDEHTDMAIPYLAICTDLIDHRGTLENEVKINQLVDSFMSKHAVNLL